ncbi:YdbH family protein [Moellerella wisconsensis]|uniref:YdbH family protein n=1 Tax=Moellerella wisconsensis TaxID=158849 RepID=UPI00307635F3
MKPTLKILSGILGLILVSLITLWLTVTHWLPLVAKPYLPEGVTLSLSQPKIDFSRAALDISQLQLKVDDCRLLQLQGATISGLSSGFSANDSDVLSMNIAHLKTNSACLHQLPVTETHNPPTDVHSLLANLPVFKLNITDIRDEEWQKYHGELLIDAQPEHGSQLIFQGDNLQLSAEITDNDQLTINQLMLKLDDQQLNLNGQLTLPITTDSMPQQGEVSGVVMLQESQQRWQVDLSWQQSQGMLSIKDMQQSTPLAMLPWRINSHTLSIQQGIWQWQQDGLPLRGGINLQLDNWQDALADMCVSARVNMVTEGSKGKGNLVLSLAPSPINLLQSEMLFSLNGRVKYDDMIVDVRLPARLSGPLLSPKVTFQPQALLRAYGQLSPTMTLQEARWPLAGTAVDLDGVTGRLQAIVKFQERYWGNFNLHLDGRAENFSLDQGLWQWRYWGDAKLPALNADWDLQGRGAWHDSLLSVNSLNTGFNRIEYGLVSMSKPRLILTEPLIWQRNADIADFKGAFSLSTQRMTFGENSYLPPTTINATVRGKSPSDFSLNGDLSAQQVGPIPFYSRWDGSRLRGMARWPKQPMTAFQTLIPPDLAITLREGDFYAQAAFSISAEQGFIGGGHWRVKNAGMWLKDGDIEGVDFVLPWRLQQSTWQLGIHSPVQLRIKQINNLFELSDITADLSGYYPPSDSHPLQLKAVGLRLLDGQLSLPLLRWPQREPATIKISNIELSRLFSTLKVSQFALSGRVDGELPFYLTNPEWIIHQGWITNRGPLTLRIDPQFMQSIKQDNISAGAAMSWLNYLEISQSQAEVNLSNLGQLTLRARVKGLNPLAEKKREVQLNYHHEENVFQLWRSLRFGSNLEQWLEKNL